MAIGLFIFAIIFIALGVVAVSATGLVFIILGTRKKKRGGKGTLRIIGIVLVAVPLFFILCMGGKGLWDNARIKCVADEWRYKPSFMPRNSVIGSSDILREMLESVDDEDESTFYRDFSENVRDDRHFEDTADDFFDDIDDLGVDLDPDDFLTDYGKNVHLDSTYSDLAGRVYSAEIEGKTYYCYVRICLRDKDKKEIGIQQFIICTEDKEDELYKIIEDDDVDIYLKVL